MEEIFEDDNPARFLEKTSFKQSIYIIVGVICGIICFAGLGFVLITY